MVAQDDGEEKWIFLPTEAQWERAARVDDVRIFPWGNTFDAIRCNSGYIELYDTTPVGIFPEGASRCGALDMAGNVWEWCWDWYDSNYYEKSPAEDPTGPSEGSFRVLRGGAWSGGRRELPDGPPATGTARASGTSLSGSGLFAFQVSPVSQASEPEGEETAVPSRSRSPSASSRSRPFLASESFTHMNICGWMAVSLIRSPLDV